MAVAQVLRVLLAEGRFHDALERYQEQAATLDSRRPDVQLLAATAATRLGELDLATTLAIEALVQFRTRGDSDGRMRCLNLLGAIHWERGRIADAERCFGEALGLAGQLGDSLMLARASNNLASVAHLQGRSDQAAGLFREALLAYHRLGDRRGTAETYHNLGFAYRQAGDWRQAESATANAVRHAEVVDEPALLALVLGAKAGAQRRAERHRPGGARIGAGYPLRCRGGRRRRPGRGAAGAGAQRATPARLGESDLPCGETARHVALEHDSMLLAAECAGISARALKALGRTEEAEDRRAQAEAGFGA